MKGTEEAIGGHFRQLFQPLHNRNPAAADTGTACEYFETIENERGMEVGKVLDRREVL